MIYSYLPHFTLHAIPIPLPLPLPLPHSLVPFRGSCLALPLPSIPDLTLYAIPLLLPTYSPPACHGVTARRWFDVVVVIHVVYTHYLRFLRAIHLTFITVALYHAILPSPCALLPHMLHLPQPLCTAGSHLLYYLLLTVRTPSTLLLLFMTVYCLVLFILFDPSTCVVLFPCPIIYLHIPSPTFPSYTYTFWTCYLFGLLPCVYCMCDCLHCNPQPHYPITFIVLHYLHCCAF